MRILVVAVLLFFLACQPASKDAPNSEVSSNDLVISGPFAHITDTVALEIVEKAVEYAGGLTRWQEIKSLRYDKEFTLFLEDGTVEKTFKQKHAYEYDPLVIDIQSQENDKLVHTWLRDDVYQRTIEGEPQEVSQEALAKSINTSTYVVGLPFKLVDPGVQINYDGFKKLEDGRYVAILKAEYNTQAHANHSSSDTWYFYCVPDTGEIVAHFVKTSDHYSLVENLSYQTAGGIQWYKDRRSYRADSLGNKLYLRARYRYEGFEVE